MRDVRVMLAELGEDESKFGSIYLDAYNREAKCFNLPKDLTITLVAGYNVRLRHAIVKRWEQLEQNAITRTPALTQEQMLAQAYVYAIERGAQQEIRLSRLTRESFTIIQ